MTWLSKTDTAVAAWEASCWRRCCRYADVRQLPVLCKVRGSGSGTVEAINTVRLMGWYRRFGFADPTADEQRRFSYQGYGLPVLIRRPLLPA